MTSYASAAPLTRKQRRDAERASQSDREWFASHPLRSHRVRPPIGAEDAYLLKANRLTPANGPVAFIVIRQHAPGIRLRYPFRAQAMPPDSEAFLHALIDAYSTNAADVGDGIISAGHVAVRATQYASVGHA